MWSMPRIIKNRLMIRKLRTKMKKIAVINLIVVFFFLSFGYVEAQTCTTKPLSQFPASPVNGQAANNLMNGVTAWIQQASANLLN